MRIKVDGDAYTKCEVASRTYWSNGKTGFFGKGIINTKGDPCKVTRIGLLGEMAVSQYLGIKPDFSYQERGTPQDFLYNGFSLEVKTASKDYGAALIRCRSDSGKVVFKPSADVFIAAVVESEDREEGFAWVFLKGWETRDFVLGLPEVPARIGFHWNYELKFGDIRGIGKLKGFLNKCNRTESSLRH